MRKNLSRHHRCFPTPAVCSFLCVLGLTLPTVRANERDGLQPSVMVIHDANRDGTKDLLVACRDGVGDGMTVLSGKSGAPLFVVPSPDGVATFPRAFSLAGDVNRDGTQDIIASGDARESSSAGSVVGVFSGRDGHLLRRLQSVGGAAFGAAVDGGKDVNGDGVADQLVGAPGAHDGDGPIVVCYSGKDGMPSVRVRAMDVSELGADAGTSGFGLAVCCIGDTDQDQCADIAVAAPLVELRRKTSEGALEFKSGRFGVVCIFSGRSGKLLRIVHLDLPRAQDIIVMKYNLDDNVGRLLYSAVGEAIIDIDIATGRERGRISLKSPTLEFSGLGTSFAVVQSKPNSSSSWLVVGGDNQWVTSERKGSAGLYSLITGKPEIDHQLNVNRCGIDVECIGDITNDGVADMVLCIREVDETSSPQQQIRVLSGVDWAEIYRVRVRVPRAVPAEVK